MKKSMYLELRKSYKKRSLLIATVFISSKEQLKLSFNQLKQIQSNIKYVFGEDTIITLVIE